ncbi:MAG: NifB/NifX family molybdenum-iron cluster-binding protein [Spirochaetales bacterium]|nr:NifB/NifX family molybdenum-iron cluster-binding protein [Spirochaetales bacterium]
MKVAIATDGDFVSAHFGRCPSFTIVEINDGEIVSRKRIDNPGHHPGYLPQFLHEMGAGYIIAGGMGQNAQMLFNQNGIKTIMGITGKVEEIINQICNGTLQGGESLCTPGAGKGYGIDKTECDHGEHIHS